MSGERDPRAHWLDDDPFDKKTSPGSHSAARDDGNWRQPHIRVVHARGPGAPFVRIFGLEEEARPIPVHTGSIWHFSKTEIEHLTQATLAFTLALAFMFTGGVMGALANTTAFVIYAVLALLTFTPGFLIHEIAHKIQARKVWLLGRIPGFSERFEIRSLTRRIGGNSLHGPRRGNGCWQYNKGTVRQSGPCWAS